MKTVLIYALVMALSTSWLQGVQAAVPEVLMESDPLTTPHCTTQAPGKLTISGATTSTEHASSVGMYLYQTAFNAASWSGSLKKFRLHFSDADDVSSMDTALVWDAADILSGVANLPAKPAAGARRIYTAVTAEDASLITMPFLWTALPVAQQAALHISADQDVADGLGEERLEYVRGERRYEFGREHGIFRARDRLLGAIVHSTPVFVGAPSAKLQDDDYLAFYEANRTRRPAVYIGADDGMLHAFDAESGAELFAYIPQAVFHLLGPLTVQSDRRRPYVDGGMTVAEARVGKQWKTILASGMGSGAQGVFALDVTRPDQFVEGMGALWEFTDADDADIGHVLGAPVIAKFKTATVKEAPIYRDFVVVASGLNNYRDDGSGKFNTQAANVLFLLALDKARSEKWRLGFNYYKFTMPISDRSLANGLTAATPVLDRNGAVTYMYAGDLQGNVWRFDFKSDAPWLDALDSSSQPLFSAKDAQGNRQAITQKIQLAFAPTGYLLLFGTGKFMEGSDLDSSRFKTQSFYAILDVLGDKANSKVLARSQLAKRELHQSDAINGALKIKGGELEYGMPDTNENGWYFDFIDSHLSGERSISSVQLIEGKLFFNTLLPNPDPCKSHDGRSYVLDVLTGLSVNANVVAYPFSSAIPTAPILTIRVPESVTQRDAIGKLRVKQRIEILTPTADDFSGNSTPIQITPIQKNPIDVITTAGRLSWREIINWLDIRASSRKK